MNLLNPYNFLNEHRLFTYAFDMKGGAVFFGIGAIGSKYPCIKCKMAKEDFINDTSLEGGELRTVEDIRHNADLYEKASNFILERISSHLPNSSTVKISLWTKICLMKQ